MVESHWKKLYPMLHHLIATGRKDPAVLAILFTESFFRDSIARSIEYVAWLFLVAVGHRRADSISVGLAQIQVRHWVHFGYGRSWWSLLHFTDPIANYDVCAALVDEVRESGDHRALLARYTGKTTVYHHKVYGQFLTNVWSSELAIARVRLPRRCSEQRGSS